MPRGRRTSRCAAPVLRCSRGSGRALTMATRPTGTSSRRKAAAAAALDCATAFQKIALDCVAAIKAHHTSACAGDAEAVHQIRVAITRLRAAVAFFAPIVVDAEWLRLKKEIAWLNGPLGAARDSDVVVEYARRKRYRAWAQRMIGEQPRSAPDAGPPPPGSLPALRSVRNACSRPWHAGSGRDRGWSATSGARTRKLCNPIARASSTAGTNGWSARDGT